MGFDDILLQQLTSIGNVVVSRHFNFEDRVINTSVNILLTSFLGILLGILIEVCFKDGYKKYKKRFMLWWNPSLENPLEFEPELLMTKKEKNEFLFKNRYDSYSSSPEDCIFALYYWFYKYHIHKDYSMCHKGTPFHVKSINHLNNVLEGKINFGTGGHGPGDDFVYKNAPIWNDKNGVVYLSYSSYMAYDIYSDSLVSLTNAMEHIENFRKEHQKKYKENTSLVQATSLWEFCKKSGGNDNGQNSFSLELKSKISHKNTFDYLHFTQKKDIIALLEKFKDGILYPPHIPMDNKMGILLHGPPGTGKTRFIAAVANYLERGVAIINFKKVKICADFDDIISKVIEKKLILVLDEIDTMEGVLTREKNNQQTNNKDENNSTMNPYMMMLLSKEKESSNMMANEMRRLTSEKDDQLTLGHILSKLDGLESCNDLLIIATTNYPERIDPALTRPGRLGFQLNLGKCTHQMLHDIFHMLFPETSEYDIEKVVKNMKEDYYTPAVLIQTCIANITFEKSVKALEEM